MGKGSQTSTTSSTTAPDSQAAGLYRDLLSRAQGVASTPYQQYGGELVAPVNSQQQTGINNVNSAAGFAQPYIGQAAGMVQGSANPLTSQQIQQYQNPYQQQVIDATMAQAAQGNAQQMAALRGNQAASGALGGNRVGVAQANLASQQSTALNSQLAALNSQNYTQGLATAQQQFQTNPQAAAYSLGNLGVSGQQAALSGASAQIGAGTLQQNTQQAQNTANYGQFQQQQAYPYQQLQWLAGLGTGVGSQLGGTSSGTSTQPAPNPWAQYAGLGLTAAGMFLKDGGAVKGPVRGFAAGGVPAMPWGDAQGWIPTMQIVGGRGAPSASMPSGGGQQQGGGDPFKQAQAMLGLGDGLRGRFSSEAYGGGSAFDGDESAYGGSGAHPLAGLSAADYGKGFLHGGIVRGFAAGGSPADFLELTNGDPAWSNPDVGAGYAMPGPSTQTPFEARGGFGEMPAAKVDPAFLRAYSDADPRGMDPRIEKAIDDNTVPLPRARPEGAPPIMAADDEAALPARAQPTRGFAPAATEMPVAANTNMPMAAASGDRSPGVGGFGLNLGRHIGLDLSPAARTGLVAAGLGMMASRAANLGNAIGEGGMHGVGAYQGVKTAEAKQELDDRKLQQQADSLAKEAQRAAADLALRTSSQQETSRHNKAQEGISAQNADRTKFIPAGTAMGDDGIIRPTVLNTGTGQIVDSLTGKPLAEGAKYDSGKAGSVTDEDAKALAMRYVKTGDKSVLTGLGNTGAARQKVNRQIAAVQKELGLTDEELGSRVVEFEGRKAGQRTLGVQEAKMGSAAFEAEGAIKLARGIIEKLPRTSFLPFNQLAEAYAKKTLNPDQAELYARAQAIVNTYSAVMSRGANITTDSSRHHAAELLNTAANPTVFNRVLDTMQQEIDMAKNSPAKMQKYYRDLYGAKTVAPEGGGAAAPAGGGSSAGFVPPAGAVARVKDGKTYYFDPATKQPYPGQ